MIPAGSFSRRGAAELLPIHQFCLGLFSRARGGARLNDAQTGIDAQDWFGRLDAGAFYLKSATHAEALLLNVPGAVSATFAFDRNMEPVVCWNTPGGAFLWWHNSMTGQRETSLFAAHRAMVLHDDVRDCASAWSDVLLVYLRAGGLYYRQQRDRYGIEYTIAAKVSGDLVSAGMSLGNRLVFRMNG